MAVSHTVDWSSILHSATRRVMDKPWKEEPNSLDYDEQGFPAAIRRSAVGALCGYIGVPEGHPWYRKFYDDIDATVHGGLTYANDSIQNLELENTWWVGFDCAHAGDLMPEFVERLPEYPLADDTYKSINYVKDEIRSLAEQASAVSVRE